MQKSDYPFLVAIIVAGLIIFYLVRTTGVSLPPLNHVLSFIAGLSVLTICWYIIRWILEWLRRRGCIFYDYKQERESIGLSTRFAAIEQLLFFVVALCGKEMFGTVAAGWLIFKGVHKWSRWTSGSLTNETSLTSIICKQAAERNLTPQHYLAATARNRFMVFVIGTGMSIAAGGISGAVYHWLKDCA